MTLDVLSYLLKHPSIDVANKQLPVSSYSQNKNEMQGKIIIPLTKLVQEIIGKDLLLTCKGSNVDFFLRLSRNDITLGSLYYQ
jgi:hypothetical protein